ncbi:MAG: hypothetical protein OEV44_14990 [Spirochaetota bacterium]|nr:hypothetical protein [Spirochaetota bacterium]
MAIILEGSDNAVVMWGKIGPYQIQRTKQGRMYLRNHVIPFNPRTTAQQNYREAWRESVVRWKAYEKINNNKYWRNIAKLRKFTSEYNAFQSSIIITYKEKLNVFGDHLQAVNYIKDINNPITYKESLHKKNVEKQNKLRINAVLKYHRSADYKTKLKASIAYLKSKGWLTKTKYGMIPYIDAIVEKDLKIKNIVPSLGGFGYGAYGSGSYGTQKIMP